MRLKHFISLFVILLTLGVGSVWAAEYEIVFQSAGSDSSTDLGAAPNVSDVVSSGAAYIASFSSCSKIYVGESGVKLGASKSAGTINFNLASSYQANIKSIKVVSAKYGTDTGTLTLYSGSTSLKLGITPGTDYTHTFESATTVSSIKLTTSTKRAYVTKIILTTEESGDDPEPATVVLKSSSCGGATFTVSESAGRNNYIVYTTDGSAEADAIANLWSSNPKYGNGDISISNLNKNTTYYYWVASEIATSTYIYSDKANFTTVNGFDIDLTASDGKGNTVSASALSCITEGTSVTLTASLALGYKVSGWEVLDENSAEITPTSTTATTFTFEMPASNVLAEASFCAAPATPTNLIYELNADATRGKTVLSWDEVAGATSYEINYTKNTEAQTPITIEIVAPATKPATSYTFNPLAVGAYTWSVKAINACGEGTATEGTGFTICPDIASVTPTVGAATDVTQTTATANWTAVESAAKYTVQVYSGESKVKEYENETGTSKAITGLTANTTYVVKVTAYNACGEASLVGSSDAFTTLKNVYTVSFNANGGTGEIAVVNVTDGESTTLPSSGMTRAGYSLSGWKANNEGDLLEKGASYQVNAVVTMYAQWSENAITVTYKPNGPTVDDVVEQFTYGEDYNAKAANTFSYSGYQFKHWNNANDGSGDVTLEAGAAYTGTEDIILYAIWDQLYSVNWIVNGTTKTTQTAIAGAALTEPYAPQTSDCDNSRAFVGWTKTQNYADAENAPEDLFDYANTLTMPVNGANYYAVFADEEGGSQLADKELEITIDNFSEITTSYTTKFTHEYTVDAASGTQKVHVDAYGVYNNSNGIQMNSGKGTYIKNTDALPGYIKKIDMTWTATGRNSPTLYAASSAVASTSSTSLGKQSNTVTEQSITIENAATNNYKYFYFDGTTVTGACYMSSLKITYVVEEDATVRTNYATNCDTSLPTCEAPTFNPAADTYVVVKNVTIATETEDATIYYTTDGSNPATSETKQTYSSPVLVDHSLTLKAVAVKEGYTNSAVTTGEYVINLPQCATPTISLPAGRYTGAQTATLSCETANASIYYTTDGSEPTVAIANLYGGEFAIDADMTVKAVAIAENTTLSEMLSASYQIVVAGSTLWELVSNVSDLKDGDIIVIASNAEGKTMSSAISNSLCSPITSTFSANKSIIESLGAGSGQFTLSKSGDNWKLSNESGYLSSASNKAMSYANEANATAWSISISGDDATINAGGSIGKIMHNVQNTRFTTYTSNASAAMLLPQIYRKSVVCEDPENELAFASSVPAAINNTQTAQLATTGGNGEDVVYTVISANKANATIDGDNKFSATAAGTYTVQAKQEMSADYKCAQVVTMDITVSVVVSGVELNKSALSLEVNQFETLEATVLPADAANKNVTWSVTEGSAYVEVDANGKVTGKAVGNGVVQVETEEGGHTATCAVTITAPTPVLTLTATTNPLAFGNVEIDSADPAEATVVLSGVNLVEDVTYEITGEDKDLFAVTTTLNNATISGVGGQEITVTFDPEALGEASATLTFKSGVAEASVALSGTGVKRFTVTLEAGNGSVTSASPREETEGGGIVLPAATLTAGLIADGWSFEGWAAEAITTEASSAPATMYAEGDTYYPAGEGETLYAIYARTNVVENTASSGSGLGCNTSWTTLVDPVRYKTSASNAYSDPMRLYNGNTLTVDGNGTTITKVVFDFNENGSYLTANKGTLSDGVWTGSEASIVFTADGKQVRINSITVTYAISTGHYTTYPSEIMHITFDLNGGEGNFPVQNVNKGADFELDGSEPTMQFFTFDGWSDGELTYAADGTITNVQGNMTLTAQWNEVGKADVIFKNGETTVQTIADKHEGESYDLIDAPAAEEGEQFTGWRSSADGALYDAGKTGMTMSTPAAEVVYTAEWLTVVPTPTEQVIIDANLSNGEWILVTNENQLNTGDVVIIAAANSAKAISTQHIDGTKYWRTQVDVTKVGNKINEPSENVVKLFVQNGFDAGQFSLYDMNTANKGYLTDVAGGNYLGTSESVQKDGSWIITVDAEGVATIQSAGTEKYIQHNSSSSRFSCYTSGQQEVALYKWVKKISDDMNVSDVTLTDAVIVEDGVTLTIDEAANLDNLTVEAGGNVSGSSNLTVNNLVIETSLGTVAGGDNADGKSGQITNSNISATGDVFIQIELTQEAEASAGWYAFSVPFPVDALNGVYYGETKLQNEVGYAIMAYHEDKRAAGEYAWKKYRDIMQPGVLYIITVGNTDYKTLRFKKVADAAIVASNEVPVSKTDASGEGESGWNGVGNPNLQISHLSAYNYMQFLDHGDNCFRARTAASTDLLVGTAFMIQHTGESETIIVEKGANSGEGNIALAPARTPSAVENTIFEAKLTNVATGKAEDNIFFTAREEAVNEYEIGRDLGKMTMGTAKCAQMSIPAYGTNLCAADFPLVDNKAVYPLTITSPADGTYSISVKENDEADIYLTYNGRVIWNLSIDACELNLSAGTTENYGLKLVKKAPNAATGVDEVNSDHNADIRKMIIDNNVYILRGGQLYDMTGKAVK